MSNQTYISFYLKSNTIRVFKSSIKAINAPMYIRFRINNETNQMIIEPYNKKKFTSFRVPQNLFDVEGSMELHSKSFCRIMSNRMKWDYNRSYRIPGKIYLEQKIIMFDLSQATLINEIK